MRPRLASLLASSLILTALTGVACSAAPADESTSGADPISARGHVMMHVRALHGDGSPIQWAWIEIDNAAGSKAYAGNAQQGEFAVSLPVGRYDVRAWNGGAFLGDTRVDLQSDLEVNVGERATHALRTTAKHANGSPIAWAWIVVDDASGANAFKGNSPNGVNDMFLLAGRYHVRAFDGSSLFAQADVDLAGDRSVVLTEGGATPPPHPAPSDGFVRAAGTGLVLNGQPWHFKGLDIYNANSRNNCWTDLADGAAMDDALNQIGSGQNAFRAWFFQKLAISKGARDWTAFDHTLAVARAHGQKVIATLENQWSACDDAAYKTEDWYRKGYTQTQPGDLDSYRDWVHEVVARYASDPTILAWQLMNEAEDSPSGDDNGGRGCSSTAAASLQAFTRDVSGLVKSLDGNHLVNIGTLAGGQCGTGGAGEWQALHQIHTIDLCEYHDYSGAGGLPSAVKTRIDECHAIGKPIFAGEVGINASSTRAAEFESKLRAQLGAGDVGVLFWAFDYGASGPSGYNIGAGDPLFQTLTRY
jgi:hypothetical protein